MEEGKSAWRGRVPYIMTSTKGDIPLVFCLFQIIIYSSKSTFFFFFFFLQEQRRTLTRTGTTDIYLSLKEVSQVRLQYSVVVEQGDAWVQQGSSPKPISRIAI